MKVCDVCGIRPATVEVEVGEGRQRSVHHLCDHCYAQLRQEEWFSPWDLFGDFFSPRRWPDREAVDIGSYLSDPARQALQDAARVSVAFGKKEMDTEHLLIALTEDEAIQELLRGFQVKPEDIRAYIEHNAPRGTFQAQRGETVKVGMSPRVKAVLELGFQEAQELGHGFVGPEHLLLGLLAEPDGLGGDTLRRFGLSTQEVRRRLARVDLTGKEGRGPRRSSTPNLDNYGRDLTELARQGKLDPVIGRAKEIETVIEVLARRKKNNPVLIGEPGVGKTAIV